MNASFDNEHDTSDVESPDDTDGRSEVDRRRLLTNPSAAVGLGAGAMAAGTGCETTRSEPGDGDSGDGRMDAADARSGEVGGDAKHPDRARPDGRDGDAFTAEPGEVQKKLNEAAEQVDRPNHTIGYVRLDACREYSQPSSPWVVPEGVVLDFNGAVLLGNGEDHDVDIMHLEPRARVHEPKINLIGGGEGYDGSNPYRGRVFVLDGTEYGSYGADGTGICGGWTMAIGGGGTWLYVRAGGSSGNENFVDAVFADSTLRRPSDLSGSTFERGIHLDSRGKTGSVRSIWVNGVFRGPKTMILQEGSQPNRGHLIEGVFAQPSDAESFWTIAPDTAARESLVRGHIRNAEPSRYTSGTAWTVASTHPDCRSNAIQSLEGIPSEMVDNRSGHDQYLTDVKTNATTTV